MSGAQQRCKDAIPSWRVVFPRRQRLKLIVTDPHAVVEIMSEQHLLP